jgi:F-type H+-transporting ATPase subunit epsilon
MASVFRLRIFTLEKSVYDSEVRSIVVPGHEGYLGVLAHHAPLIAALRPGRLTIKDAGGKESIHAVSGGFLEVSANLATLLADAVEQVCDIDLQRAERARDRALERLESKQLDIDVARARAALSRAMNRIQVFRSQASH